MNKRIIIGAIVSTSLLALPVAVQARRGADDPVGHVRQEDRQLGRQADDSVKVPATQGTTNAASTPAGSVLSVTSSDDTSSTTSSEATVTLEQAIAKAKEQFPDKTVKKTETEQEHGKTVYEVKFTDDSEVEIDATTGEIIELRDRAQDNSGRHGSDHQENEDDDDHSGRSHN